MALRTGTVARSERRGLQWRRIVRGADIDGNSITMIVTVVYHFRRIVVLEIEGEQDEE
jgi:mRNA-degrading endonuclease HigB of HigAB toxin-antitoxin module